MGVRNLIPWLCWEKLFSMLCRLCTDKGSSLNLDLMTFGNYVVIHVYANIYMYVCMSFLTISLLFYVDVYMYICVCMQIVV